MLGTPLMSKAIGVVQKHPWASIITLVFTTIEVILAIRWYLVPSEPTNEPAFALFGLLMAIFGVPLVRGMFQKGVDSNKSHRPILRCFSKYIPVDHSKRNSFTHVAVFIENIGDEIEENVIIEIVIKDDKRILANTSGEAFKRGIVGSINPGENVGFSILSLLEESPEFSLEYTLYGSLALVNRKFEVTVHATYTDADGIHKFDAPEFILSFLWESHRGGGQARHIESCVFRRIDKKISK